MQPLTLHISLPHRVNTILPPLSPPLSLSLFSPAPFPLTADVLETVLKRGFLESFKALSHNTWLLCPVCAGEGAPVHDNKGRTEGLEVGAKFLG